MLSKEQNLQAGIPKAILAGTYASGDEREGTDGSQGIPMRFIRKMVVPLPGMKQGKQLVGSVVFTADNPVG